MLLIRAISEVPEPPRPTVVTIGNFDGVHLAHQKLLRRVVERARANGSIASALTFDPHPMQVLAPDRAPRVLTPLPEKARLIEGTGIELLWALTFTHELSLMTPVRFVEDVLVRDLRVAAVVVGPNFRYGHRHAGDDRLLVELGNKHAFEVEISEPVVVRGEMVSSSRVRELADLGRVHLAGRLLGRPFSVSGPIVRGLGIGKQQTVPTLNLAHVDQRIGGQAPRQIPKPGVYVTRTRVAGVEHQSVTNIGRKPTFGEHEITVESFLLDYRGPRIEADEMEIQFLHRLRDERKFPDAAALKNQIIKDAGRALGFFRRLSRFERTPPAQG
jgi:riboflavin kinase / FMN adenylyltransferase